MKFLFAGQVIAKLEAMLTFRALTEIKRQVKVQHMCAYHFGQTQDLWV